MKSLLMVLIAVGTTVFCNAQKQKVLFVIADGIPADVLEKAAAPNLKKIIAAGSYKRAYVGGERGGYSQSPTISAVGYNSLLTGTWAQKHNVWDNDIDSPNYSYPTIFKLFKDQYPDKQIAIFSSWTDNRTKLAGANKAETNHLKFDFAADGFELDTAALPHDTAGLYMHRIDERVVGSAAACIRKNAPDLSWIYLEYTDDMGHKFGDSKKFQKAIAYLDAQMGKVWQAIQYRKHHFGEDWLLLITTDHGRDAQTGKDHGGQSDRERTTWVVSTIKNGNGYFKKFEPGVVDLLPTMATYLNVSLPQPVNRELDGVSLIGPVSIARPTATYAQDSIQLQWTAFDKTDSVKIWITTTNEFKRGASDAYALVAQVPTGSEKLVFKPALASPFYKIVLEGKHNTVNCWLVTKNSATALH